MKLIMKIVKNLVFGIFSIYSFNVLFSALNIFLPINLFTILMSSFFGIYGSLTILILKLIM